MNRQQRRAAAARGLPTPPPAKPNVDARTAEALAAARTLLGQGDFAGAEESFQAIVKRNPRAAAAFHGLGTVALHRGDMPAAETALARAVALEPGNGLAWMELGLAVSQRDRWREALEHFRRARTLAPNLSPAWLYEAMALDELGEVPAAIEGYERVVAFGGARADTLLRLTKLYNRLAKMPDAERVARLTIATPEDLAGQHLEAAGMLGQALHRMARFAEAEAVLRDVLRRTPGLPGATGALAHLARDQGRSAEAAALYEAEAALAPDDGRIASNLLFTLAGARLESPDQILERARGWAARHAPEPARPVYRDPDRAPDRVLRIGYVSPDFRTHPVTSFMAPVIAAHDRARVSVHGYSTTDMPDEETARLAALCDVWRPTVGSSPTALAERIAEDRIDILVELAGHSGDHPLAALALRPAPIQATYLGYFGTTGLSQVDYWITDGVLHPENTAERASETFWRLPRCWMAWAPPPDCPPVAIRPTDGPLVFGSYNSLSKIGDVTIKRWAAVLRGVPDSRLLLKTWTLLDGDQRNRLTTAFAAEGVDPTRLDLRNFIPHPGGHLASYGEMDIGLDPAPYSGATTTTEALWMGVPVLTVAGEVMVDRMSTSLLSALGLDEFIATSTEDMVARAQRFAADRTGLATLRATQRARFAASPLGDAPGLSRALETGYRAMWNRWLETSRA